MLSYSIKGVKWIIKGLSPFPDHFPDPSPFNARIPVIIKRGELGAEHTVHVLSSLPFGINFVFCFRVFGTVVPDFCSKIILAAHSNRFKMGLHYLLSNGSHLVGADLKTCNP